MKYLNLKLKASMTLVIRDIALPIKCLHKCQISWNLSLQCSNNSKVEQINSGLAGNYNIDSILKLFFSIDEKYAHNAKFLMSRSALQTIRMLKDKNENYIWQPSTSSGSPDTLFGAAVLQSSDMPQLKEGSLSIAFGDFSRFYTIVRRVEVKILRDNLTSKPNIKFFARTAIGGDIDDFSAVKLLKASA